MDEALRNLVRRRAQLRCEYCRMPESCSIVVPFHVEHIIARKHHGLSVASNLALACHRCNLFKSANLSGVDPVSRRIVPLFHPRRHSWTRHFNWQHTSILGRTAIGRATVDVLAMNNADRIQFRAELFEEGQFPW